jgi:hypothetical protein
MVTIKCKVVVAKENFNQCVGRCRIIEKVKDEMFFCSRSSYATYDTYKINTPLPNCNPNFNGI